MGPFPVLLLLLALTGPCMAGEHLETARRQQGDTFETMCCYDKRNYSQKQFWCRQLSEVECNTLILFSPEKIYQNISSRTKISLTNCVIMTDLRVEDSGIYWCGVSDNLKIIPLTKMKLTVSYEAPMRLSVKKGDSVSLNCSYFVMGNSWQPKNFTWCKMVTATRCQPLVGVEFHQIANRQGRTNIMVNSSNQEVTVMLRELQLHDSGEYWCEAYLPGSTVLLKMIALNVLESYYGMDFVTTSHPVDKNGAILPPAAKNDEQSWNPEASAYGPYIIAAWLGTKCVATVLILIIACSSRSRAMGQETRGQNKHQFLPLTGLKRK